MILMATLAISLFIEGQKDLLKWSPDLALLLTLSGSNYLCLEQISIAPKMFELLKFDCTYFFIIIDTCCTILLLSYGATRTMLLVHILSNSELHVAF